MLSDLVWRWCLAVYAPCPQLLCLANAADGSLPYVDFRCITVAAAWINLSAPTDLAEPPQIAVNTQRLQPPSKELAQETPSAREEKKAPLT